MGFPSSSGKRFFSAERRVSARSETLKGKHPIGIGRRALAWHLDIMDTISLRHREWGTPGKPVAVLLHGLLGNSKNWTAAAKLLASHWQVLAVDLRNHGESPHSPIHTYDAMVHDLLHWINDRTLPRPWLIGHSMGGKTAMLLACRHPEIIRGLVLVDIAPKDNPPRWQEEFAAMRKMDTSRLQSRREAEDILAPLVSDDGFRKFLVSNLVALPSGSGYRWQVNLETLQAALPHLMQNHLRPEDRYEGPSLLIRGAKSPFVQPKDETTVRRHFPSCRIVTIEASGHNVHAEQPQAFAETVLHWASQESGAPLIS